MEKNRMEQFCLLKYKCTECDSHSGSTQDVYDVPARLLQLAQMDRHYTFHGFDKDAWPPPCCFVIEL